MITPKEFMKEILIYYVHVLTQGGKEMIYYFFQFLSLILKFFTEEVYLLIGSRKGDMGADTDLMPSFNWPHCHIIN